MKCKWCGKETASWDTRTVKGNKMCGDCADSAEDSLYEQEKEGRTDEYDNC